MKRLFLALAFMAGLVGCGKKDGGNYASGPVAPPYGGGQYGGQYGYGSPYGQNYCMQQGGYGCGWQQQYPGYVQGYPMQNGYYTGYNNGAYAYGGYSYFAGCYLSYGNGWSPIYQQQGGLACMNTSYLPQGGNYYQYNYGGYSAYQYCNAQIYGSCPGGTRCMPMAPSGTMGVCQY